MLLLEKGQINYTWCHCKWNWQWNIVKILHHQPSHLSNKVSQKHSCHCSSAWKCFYRMLFLHFTLLAVSGDQGVQKAECTLSRLLHSQHFVEKGRHWAHSHRSLLNANTSKKNDTKSNQPYPNMNKRHKQALPG